MANVWSLNNIVTQVNSQIANLNSALANSGLDVVVQSAGVVSFDSTGVTSIFDMPAAGQQSTLLRLRRDTAGADVVMMLGFFGQASGQALQVGSTANTAFAAVDITALPNYTYLHEFAHLLGARHQYTGAQLVNTNDTTGSGHGAYIQIAGTDPGAAAGSSIICLHTIMAYTPVDKLNGLSCTSSRILWYSTPSGAADFYGQGSGAVTWHITNPSFGGNSRNTTFANYNNAAVMRAYAPIVASFHNTKLAGGIAVTIGGMILNMLMIDP
ncbi:hypothetical protein [Roseateles sp.]|uniref:hypothetical protein n=1 Tax=Roseateles sp. TaxID=1971397 RepID=UPI003BAC2EE1